MKQKVFSYLKKLPTFFGLTFLMALSVFSFSSYFSSENFSSFSKAVSETPNALYESRMILGCKNELANDYVIRDIKTKHTDGVIPYRVGLNNESTFFKCGDTFITPIESNCLRYYWSDEVYKQALIQDINIISTGIKKDFESDPTNIVISSSFYLSNDRPETISVYSSILDKTLEFHVIGYYVSKSDKYKTIAQMFYEVYQEPMFFNISAFEEMIDYDGGHTNTFQTDLIFSTTYNYNATIGALMSKRNWKKNFVRYSQFDEVYSKMDGYISKSKMHFIIIGVAALLSFALAIFALIKFFPSYFSSLFKVSPYIATIFMFAPLFGFYLFLRFFRGGSLFIASSFGLSVSITIILLIVYTILYFWRKRGLNGTKN